MSKITIDSVKAFDCDINEQVSEKEMIRRNMILQVKKQIQDWEESLEKDDNKKITSAFNDVILVQKSILDTRLTINNIILGKVNDAEIELNMLQKKIPNSKKNLWNVVFFEKVRVSLLLQYIHQRIDEKNLVATPEVVE
ncbi:MAG: hypothetical protein MJZ34_02430 [Paludibacteraceae bacterium]|nr:hypothetical protein [Paludibacteraceae bacterium]